MAVDPTIAEPSAAPAESKVLRMMRCLCQIRGTAFDGIAARYVYAELFSTNPGAPPPNRAPVFALGVNPNEATGAYNLDKRIFITDCGNVASDRWLWVTAEWSNPPGPPIYTTAAIKISVKLDDACPAEGIEDSFARILASAQLTAAATAFSGWKTVTCKVNEYPIGSQILPAESDDQVSQFGETRDIEVYAKTVDWNYSSSPVTKIHSPAGNGIAAPSTFWLPGAPQYSVVLWQPPAGTHGPIAHVVTAQRRRDAQLLTFDRRLPVFAQVNDDRSDFFASNTGTVKLAIRNA